MKRYKILFITFDIFFLIEYFFTIQVLEYQGKANYHKYWLFQDLDNSLMKLWSLSNGTVWALEHGDKTTALIYLSAALREASEARFLSERLLVHLTNLFNPLQLIYEGFMRMCGEDLISNKTIVWLKRSEAALHDLERSYRGYIIPYRYPYHIPLLSLFGSYLDYALLWDDKGERANALESLSESYPYYVLTDSRLHS